MLLTSFVIEAIPVILNGGSLKNRWTWKNKKKYTTQAFVKSASSPNIAIYHFLIIKKLTGYENVKSCRQTLQFLRTGSADKRNDLTQKLPGR